MIAQDLPADGPTPRAPAGSSCRGQDRALHRVCIPCILCTTVAGRGAKDSLAVKEEEMAWHPIAEWRTSNPGSSRSSRSTFRNSRSETASASTASFSKSFPQTFAAATSTWSAAARPAPEGLVLGHEITGEVIEAGSDVEFIAVGDLCSVPFNIACGRCRNCKDKKTGVCLNVNPARPGAAYGYVDMGGWVGGQAEYVMVPYARLQLVEVSRQRPGDGEDRRSYAAFGHFPDGIPRRRHGGGRSGIDRLRGGRRPGRGWPARTAASCSARHA